MTNLESHMPDALFESPCTAEAMNDFLAYVGPVPHDDYLAFMERHNGCEGPIGKWGFLRIWSLNEAVVGTEDAGTAQFAPELLLFADAGGDTVCAFDRQDSSWPIVSVSLTSMSRNEMEFVAASFTEFIERLAVSS
jgi:hypothetical protein